MPFSLFGRPHSNYDDYRYGDRTYGERSVMDWVISIIVILFLIWLVWWFIRTFINANNTNQGYNFMGNTAYPMGSNTTTVAANGQPIVVALSGKCNDKDNETWNSQKHYLNKSQFGYHNKDKYEGKRKHSK